MTAHAAEECCQDTPGFRVLREEYPHPCLLPFSHPPASVFAGRRGEEGGEGAGQAGGGEEGGPPPLAMEQPASEAAIARV